MTALASAGLDGATLRKIAVEIEKDPDLAEEMKKDPSKTLLNMALANPLERDEVIYRIVVGSLGLAVIVALVGAILLAAFNSGTKQPEILLAVGAAAVGALAGLLTPTARRA